MLEWWAIDVLGSRLYKVSFDHAVHAIGIEPHIYPQLGNEKKDELLYVEMHQKLVTGCISAKPHQQSSRYCRSRTVLL